MEQDRIPEAGSVAVAAGSLLELLDLGVDRLEVSVGDPEDNGIDDAPQVLAEGAGDLHHRLQPRAVHPSNEPIPSAMSPAASLVRPQVSSRLLHRPRPGYAQLRVAKVLEPRAVAGLHVLRVLQPQV